MKIKITLKKIIPIILLMLTSCEKTPKIISSHRLNKADGIYKYKEIPFTGTVIDTTLTGRVLLTFKCEKGKPNGEHLEYFFDSGNLKERITYIDGKKEGSYKKINNNGVTIITGNYHENKKNGKWKKFYENGNLKTVGSYKDGIKIGEWKNFYENGNLENYGFYNNDEQNGKWTYYYRNGNIKASGFFIKGNGRNLGKTGVPKNGRNGPWEFYNEETGQINVKIIYDEGRLSGNIEEYNSEGNIEFKATFKNDKLHGTVEEFNNQGVLTSKEIYENGKMVNKIK